MSANSSAKKPTLASKRWWLVVLLPLWVLVGFGLAQLFLMAILLLLRLVNVSIVELNQAVLGAVLSASVYVVTLAIVLGGPWLVKRRRVNLQELGMQRLPSWLDIGLAPAGFVVYLVATVVLTAIMTVLIPGFDLEQIQETGFENISQRYEFILAFFTLVVVAPIAEEVLFRGYLYGKLRPKVPIWAAIAIVSAIFAAVHGQWNVAVDVFALSIVLCVLREITGSIWAGTLLHMLKNGVAFYFLFINPLVL